MLADGNVYPREGKTAAWSTKVSIKLKDGEHVQKFADFLKTEYKVSSLVEDGRTKHYLHILSTPIAEDLARFGVVGDLFDIVPAFAESLKIKLGR